MNKRRMRIVIIFQNLYISTNIAGVESPRGKAVGIRHKPVIAVFGVWSNCDQYGRIIGHHRWSHWGNALGRRFVQDNS